MSDFFRQFKHLLLGISLVLLGLHLASSSLSKGEKTGSAGQFVIRVYAPIHSLISWPFARTADMAGRYLLLMDLNKENKILKKENTALRLHLHRLNELDAENLRLRHLLEFSPPRGIEPIYARIMVRSVSSTSLTLLIDKGTMQGVEKDMIAMTPAGLLGHVNLATPGAAKILLITDPSSVVDAVIQRTRAAGMVKGKGAGLCSLNFLNRTDDVETGDLVISSGMGGLFPSGLVLGRVTRIERDSTDMFLSVEVTPTADFDRLEEVIILPGEKSAENLGPEDQAAPEEAGGKENEVP